MTGKRIFRGWPGAAAGALAILAAAACTPQQVLVSALLPDGTVSVLLSHLEHEPDSNRRRIVEMEGRRDWDGIAKFAEENLAKDPHTADWWFVAGYAHSQAGRHQRAVECFSEMVRLAPDETLGSLSLAQAYRDAGQPQRAVQALDNVLRFRKNSPAVYFLLGESYSDLDRDLPAAAAYREAVKLDPSNARAWYGLGRASARLRRAADYEAALAALGKLDAALAKRLAELRPGQR
jgi:tetratricopeptide (TPR) repeat protein